MAPPNRIPKIRSTITYRCSFTIKYLLFIDELDFMEWSGAKWSSLLAVKLLSEEHKGSTVSFIYWNSSFRLNDLIVTTLCSYITLRT